MGREEKLRAFYMQLHRILKLALFLKSPFQRLMSFLQHLTFHHSCFLLRSTSFLPTVARKDSLLSRVTVGSGDRAPQMALL